MHGIDCSSKFYIFLYFIFSPLYFFLFLNCVMRLSNLFSFIYRRSKLDPAHALSRI